MRKLFLLVLLIAGWAIIFSPLLSGNPAGTGIFSSQAHPSTKPLPQPWQDSPKIQLNHSSGVDEASSDQPSTSSSGCGDSYTLQQGDTLGEVARACGISLKDLLNENPQIENPNRIFAGEEINLPDPLAGRGSGDSPALEASPVQSGGFQPGGEVQIDMDGLPPLTGVKIGLGLSLSGYRVLSEAQTDEEGRLSVTITLPDEAQTGESGFIMITTQNMPAQQRVSETFTVGY